jgi:hypothetical protein
MREFPPEKKPPRTCFTKDPNKLVQCPECFGHGGWTETLPNPVHTDGPDRVYRYGCSQCNGWGWVEKDSDDAKCLHKMKELSQDECRKRGIQHWGMCWHVYECVYCGTTKSYDSSG